MATLAQLVGIRSQLAEDYRRYCEALIAALEGTPWHHVGGKPVRVSEVAVPVRVLKEETDQHNQDRDRLSRRGMRREREDSDDRRDQLPPHVDPELAELYEEPTYATRRTEVPWEHERQTIRRAVILGSPGGGKTFLRACLKIPNGTIEAGFHTTEISQQHRVLSP